MKSEEKVAQQRLSVLELAKALDNESETCRQREMTRTQFYENKCRFQTHGMEDLKDLLPIHHSHPFTTPTDVIENILDKSLEAGLETLPKRDGSATKHINVQLQLDYIFII